MRQMNLLSPYLGIAAAAFQGAKAVSALNNKWLEGFDDRSGAGGYTKASGVDVWLHGASVGEVGGLVPLVRELRSAIPSIKLHVSTTSLTGRAEAAKLAPSNVPTLLPFDASKPVARVLDILQPQLLVIAETEIWPTLYRECSRRGVKIVIINGRISDMSFPRYRIFRPFLQQVLNNVARFFVQTELDKQRYEALGAPGSTIRVCGSTKYDQAEMPSERNLAEFAAEIGIDPKLPCLAAGSVRPGEAEQVLQAYRDTIEMHPELQLIIAPRHPDKFEEVAKAIADFGLAFHRRSAGDADRIAKVVLLDSIGELKAAYGIATIAYVGGTLVPIGGHNPLEPAAFAIPVIVGPHTSNVRDAISQLAEAGAHLRIAGSEELTELLKKLLESPAQVAEIGIASRRVWEANAGATNVVSDYVAGLLGYSDVSADQTQRRGIS